MSNTEKEVPENEVLIRIIGRAKNVKTVLSQLNDLFGETYPSKPTEDRIFSKCVRIYCTVIFEEEES